MKQVVLATKNKGKIREFNAALAQLGMVGVPVNDVVDVPEPDENGATFLENALWKAQYYGASCGLPAMADDSGLAVDVLGGAPGVLSARYAGIHGDDHANNMKLIHAVREYPLEERTARYICALALVMPDGTTYTAEGTCEGLIQTEAIGDGGFGYDPYFYLPSFGTTIANISLAEKNQISHRGKALQQLIAKIVGEVPLSTHL